MKLNLPQKKCQTCNIDMIPEFPEKFNFKLNGWFCLGCETFDRAIGRERFFRKHDFDKAKTEAQSIKKEATNAPKAKAKGGNASAKTSEDEGGED